MKKISAILFAFFAGILCMNAQDDAWRADSLQAELNKRDAQLQKAEQKQRNSGIWGKARYTRIGYVLGQFDTDYDPIEKTQFGVYIGKGNSFLFPSQPVANMVKFGFDVNWFEYTINKYESKKIWDEDGSHSFIDKVSNIGRLNMFIGALGIGPNVTVAPFSKFNNAAQYIKASIYFHYQPTFGINMLLDDGDFETSFAYCNMWQFGGNIKWKNIGIGVEGYWGSGKFKPLSLDFLSDDDDDFDDGGSNKILHRFANTRIYLTLAF